MRAGAPSIFTWRIQHGFLGNPADVRNQEFTVFARVQGIHDPKRAALSLKIRGGIHTESAADKASCIMLPFQRSSTGAVTRFGKELDHPAELVERRWYGFKIVSYDTTTPKHVMNRLYLDTDPFDHAGRPKNNWRLFSEYEDAETRSTGRYSEVVDWGGWQTTLRSDGIASLDFLLISVREIVPPQ
ncbi:MAG: hypothetical protein ABI945_01630 [Nitrospirales bacterium]